MTSPSTGHKPVMLREALGLLDLVKGGFYIDACLGDGGHALAICEVVGPCGAVVAIDRDPEAVRRVEARVGSSLPQLRLVHGNFAEMDAIARSQGFETVRGVLMDLGLSSVQLDPGSGRGFSFMGDEPLDARMDQSRGPTLADVIATIDESELAHILRRYGDEPLARRIAQAVVAERAASPIRTTGRLADVVRRAVGPSTGRIDPATRAFMALRIHLNSELECLSRGLAAAEHVLAGHGRLVVLSYHSGEDRVVKKHLAGSAKGCVCPPRAPVCVCGRKPTLRPLTRRPLRPSEEEVRDNPRARSCKLRAAERAEEASDGRIDDVA